MEVFTVPWMVVEAAVSIGAGVSARSARLFAFGLDRVIELISGTVLLWRLSLEAQDENTKQIERAKRRVTRRDAASSFMCGYTENPPISLCVLACFMLVCWFA